EHVSPEGQGAADSVIEVFGRIRGPFSVLLKSPALAERMLGMVKFNREGCIVDGRLRSHAILAAVRERESAYVWSAQVGAARRAGVPDTTIDLLRAGGDVSGLGEDERDIVNLTRQLMRTNRAEYPVFNRLLGKYGEQWMVELITIAHYFVVLSGVTNAFEVAVPPDGDQLP
ncbi:MAG: carboxymuconolactone decarboxylase family protein, partial [Stellaceae bacterium]